MSAPPNQSAPNGQSDASSPSSNPTVTVTVRPATPADAAAICTIGAGTFRASFGYSMPEAHVDEYLSTTYNAPAIAAEIAAPENTFFVAELQTPTAPQVAGFLQMKTNTTEPCIPSDVISCELHRIYVSKDHLAAGIGGKLMAKGVQWAEEHVRGAKKEMGEYAEDRRTAVWLGVWEDNVKAQRFYARSGFERVGIHAFEIAGTTQYDHIVIKYF